MLRIEIKNLTDGEHSFALTAEADSIELLGEEFVGKITCDGVIKRSGRRYIVAGAASCRVQLVCDISGEDFEDIISADLDLTYLVDSLLYHEQQAEEVPQQPYYLHEEQKHIDLTEEVRQELIVAMPMRRISPAYQGKDFADLYPDRIIDGDSVTDTESDETPPVDDRWAALRNIKF